MHHMYNNRYHPNLGKGYRHVLSPDGAIQWAYSGTPLKRTPLGPGFLSVIAR